MRYYNGVWLGVGGTVLYRGHFAYHHAPPDRRESWVRTGGVVNGHVPIHGRIEHEGGIIRPAPPPDSIHARPMPPPSQQQNWQQQSRQPEHEQVRGHDQPREQEHARPLPTPQQQPQNWPQQNRHPEHEQVGGRDQLREHEQVKNREQVQQHEPSREHEREHGREREGERN